MKAWNLRSIPLMIAVGFFGLGDSIFAQSELLTFDDLQAIGFPPVPNGYGGLGWQNFSYMDGVHFASPSGYNNGVVSPNIVAYGWGGLDYPSSLISIQAISPQHGMMVCNCRSRGLLEGF